MQTKDILTPQEIELRKNCKIAIVQAEFNHEITNGLSLGATDYLVKSGIKEHQIEKFIVSGAIEIPLIVKMLASKPRYQGIIALGCVIQGDTTHYDYVCKFVTEGILRVSLDQSLPISFGILTTNNLEQAQIRSKFPSQANKGRESAYALIKQIQLIRDIESN